MPIHHSDQISTPSADRTIAVESSTWNNLGDAFYQNSILYQVRKLFPDWTVVSMDGPPQRAFRPRKHMPRVHDARLQTNAAHYIFSGPIMGATFVDHYGPLIRELTARGRSYSLMSLHCNAEGETLSRNIEFLKEYPPTAIHTRDRMTFDKLRGIAPVEMDGICFAFFVSQLPNLPILDQGGPYICASYYRGWEPGFSNVSENATQLDTSGVVLDWPKQPTQKHWRFLRLLEHRRPSPTALGPWKIVRPVHAFSPLPSLIFSKSNSYISYNPDNFLAIYKYCDGVLTDRVHAAVAALSFGKPAKVEKVDSRFTLFASAPVQEANGFFTLSPEALNPYYDAVSSWLTNDFARSSGLRTND